MNEIEKNNEDWLDITIKPNQTKESLIKEDGNVQNISDFFSTNIISSSSLDDDRQENMVEYNNETQDIKIKKTQDIKIKKTQEIDNNEIQDIKIKNPLEIDNKKQQSNPIIKSLFNCRTKCFHCILM